jgi:thiol-disulfide isomerase/thioredoxin
VRASFETPGAEDRRMRRSTLVGVVVGAVVVAGVAAAVALSIGGQELAAAPTSSSVTAPTEAGATPSATSSPESTSPAETPGSAQGADAAPGAYVDFSDAALADAEGTRVLFFHAPWCPQCRALEADIAATGVPSGVTVLKVDYDSRQDLRQRYGVTIQTTVVALDDAGDGVATFVAYDDPTLDSALTGLGLG